MKVGFALVSLLLSVLLPLTSEAAPLRWHLQGVVFADGATMEGSFTFDADTNTYSDIDVVTGAGLASIAGGTETAAVPGIGYDRISIRLPIPPSPEIVYVDDAEQDVLQGTGIVELSFRSPLTNAGGEVALAGTSGPPVPSGFAGELFCPPPQNYPCEGTVRVRLLERGVVTTHPSYPVPILGPWAALILVLAFFVLAATALRSARSRS